MKQDPLFKILIQKSKMEIPDRNFEYRVMQKIEFAAGIVKQRRKNLKLSWGFLGLSAFLLPVLLLIISKSILLEYLVELGINLSGAANIIMPAAVLISAIIILVQVDNLYRLSLQMR